MLINTAVFGEMDVKDENIFDMPNGLFGFDFSSKYALITKQEDDVTLMWYQAAESVMPCFVVFDPFEIINGYEPVLEKSDLKALNAKDISALRFLVIAVVPDDISKITVNLKSPIVINHKENIARQVILQNANYPIKFPLTDSPAAGEDDHKDASVGDSVTDEAKAVVQ
ncbi:MAG: flagellar assembly protein FliW [Oscillospiraceae bacterium]|jgi:flagellar assembly factor FliW|nr:flagellar assembly protein FliW [Oscillospiraceae bacterium]